MANETATRPGTEHSSGVRAEGPRPLTPADKNMENSPPAPSRVTIELIATAVGPNGFPISISVRGVSFDSLGGAVARAKQLDRELETAGFKVPGPATVGAPAAPAAAGGQAPTMTKNEDGTFSCPLHGVGRFVPPGKNAQGRDYPGFWACNEKDCKARPPRK